MIKQFHPHEMTREAWLGDVPVPLIEDFLAKNNRLVNLRMNACAEERKRIMGDFVDETAPSASPFSRIGDWSYAVMALPDRKNLSYVRIRSAPEATTPYLVASDSSDRDVVFDIESELSESKATGIGTLDVNMAGSHLAYQLGYENSDSQDLFVREIDTHHTALLARNTVPGALMMDGESSVYYLTSDSTGRPDRLWQSRYEHGTWLPTQVFDEPDVTRRLAITRTRSRRFIVVHSFDKNDGQAWLIDTSLAGVAQLQRIPFSHERVRGAIDHTCWGGTHHLVILEASETCDRILARPLADMESVREIWSGPAGSVDAIDAWESFLVLTHRTMTNRVVSIADNDAVHPYDFVPIATAPLGWTLGLSANTDWRATSIILGDESTTMPGRLYRYDVGTSTKHPIHVPSPRSSFAPSIQYRMLLAVATDGEHIPITLLSPSESTGPNPLVLRVYGAYGVSTPGRYSPATLWLLKQGISVGVAHVRGGGERGPAWHRAATGERKGLSATDYIACAEEVVRAGYARFGLIAGEADSAGGLALGGAVNLSPGLFRCVLMRSPFLDPVGTLSDPSTPLTTTEWSEFGNPLTDAQTLQAMKEYSPMDNIKKGTPYPACLVSVSRNDSRVSFQEGARWASALQSNGTVALLRTFGSKSGHLGPSDPDERLAHTVFEHLWLRDQLTSAEADVNRGNHG